MTTKRPKQEPGKRYGLPVERFNCEIPQDLSEAVAGRCAAEGTTKRAFVIQALREKLKRGER